MQTGVFKRNPEYHPYEGTENDPRPNEPKVNDCSLNVPPLAPVLKSRRAQQSEAFFVNAGDITASREIRFTVEFRTHLQQAQPNDVALYFIRFATLLLSAHPSLSILN